MKHRLLILLFALSFFVPTAFAKSNPSSSANPNAAHLPSDLSDRAEGTAGGYGDAMKLVLNVYRMDRAAASNSSARGLTRMSSVKFSQRTVPERSIRNSAGRAISVPSGPPRGCKSSNRRITSAFGSERNGNV
jgi:hypothetical protein